MTRNPKFDKALQIMKDIHDAKNIDYSAGGPYDNFELTAAITTGDINDAFRIPIANKLARAKSLMVRGGANFEPLEDTLKDLAVYSTLWYSYQLEDDDRP